MRILHVLDHSIPLQSGYAYRTIAIVREQRALGWETFHLTSPKHTALSAAEETVDGLHFYRTAWNAGALTRIPVAREIALMRATAARMRELAQRLRPDILHAHSPVLNAIPALAVGRRLGIPVVYEVRAFWEDAAADHGTSREWGLRYRLTRGLESFALRRVQHVTTICEGLKRDIVSRGIPENRVTIVPNAVNPSEFRFAMEPDETLKSKFGLTGTTVVGFIGSFYAYEGLDLLLKALAEVSVRMPYVRLLLVGGGPHENSLRRLASDLGIEDKVVLAGRVPHHEIHRYYSMVDVFAYPRRSMRLTDLVTPLKPLEAMAHGCPVLASDVGGHRELIRDGETGVLFRAGSAASLADALLRLIAQRESWPRLREQGRRYVESERNWAESVKHYRDIFGRLSAAGA